MTGADAATSYLLRTRLRAGDDAARKIARVFGKETIDGHETWAVGSQLDEHTRQRVWFDANTGLAVRRLITVDSPVGRIPTQTDFDDYRDVNGVKVPFTVKVSSVNGGQNATRKYTSIELGSRSTRRSSKRRRKPPPVEVPTFDTALGHAGPNPAFDP